MDSALTFFEKNKDYKDSAKYIETIKAIKPWVGKWNAEIPYLNGDTVDTEVTIISNYEDDKLGLIVFFEADNYGTSSYSGGAVGGFSWKPSGGSSSGGGAGGSGYGSVGGGLAKQSYIKTSDVVLQKMASYMVDEGYYYEIAGENKIQPTYNYKDYSSYNSMNDDEKTLMKDLVVPIQLNDNSTITLLNNYKWTLNKTE